MAKWLGRYNLADEALVSHGRKNNNNQPPALPSPPPIISRTHPTATSITYCQTRVEMKLLDGFNNTLESDPQQQRQQQQQQQQRQQSQETTESTPATPISLPNPRCPLNISITYLHRDPLSKITDIQQRNGGIDTRFYATHPFFQSASFLPLMWLYGIIIIPIIDISALTTRVIKKMGDWGKNGFGREGRGIGPLPWLSSSSPSRPQQSTSCEEDFDFDIYRSRPHPQPAPLSSYPLGFIPPILPSIPPTNPHRHGQHGSNSFMTHQISPQEQIKIGGGDGGGSIDNPHTTPSLASPSPFTIPPRLGQFDLFEESIYSRSCDIPGSMYDPCRAVELSSEVGTNLAHHKNPITFIALVLNPISPDPVPWTRIGIDNDDDDDNGDDNGNGLSVGLDQLFNLRPDNDDREENATQTPQTANPLNNNNNNNTPNNRNNNNSTPFSPITQSEFRYWSEYLPPLWKRELTQVLFGAGPVGDMSEDLEQRWSVEVHTPKTMMGAFGRLEQDAVRRRLGLFRDAVVGYCYSSSRETPMLHPQDYIFLTTLPFYDEHGLGSWFGLSG
jgi:hypothetical protein